MKVLILLLLTAMSLQSTATANDQAFPKTNVDNMELKTIPASRLIASESSGHYFKENNGLFRPLFRYISQNNIAMTTPVEAEIMPGKMYFYIGGDAAERELKPTETVRVLEIPERLVASIGVRGSYSEKNFNEALKKLESWLENHPTHKASGEARGIFWNGPFTPGFFKRFEVHLPVVERIKYAD
ncbi:MAG: heme-binding protein [Opitutales bacterium]